MAKLKPIPKTDVPARTITALQKFMTNPYGRDTRCLYKGHEHSVEYVLNIPRFLDCITDSAIMESNVEQYVIASKKLKHRRDALDMQTRYWYCVIIYGPPGNTKLYFDKAGKCLFPVDAKATCVFDIDDVQKPTQAPKPMNWKRIITQACAKYEGGDLLASELEDIAKAIRKEPG